VLASCGIEEIEASCIALSDCASVGAASAENKTTGPASRMRKHRGANTVFSAAPTMSLARDRRFAVVLKNASSIARLSNMGAIDQLATWSGEQ